VQLIAHGGIGKTARTSSPCRFWRFSPFARGQYPRTAPTRKMQNLSHFLNILQRVEIYYLTFSTRKKNGCSFEQPFFVILYRLKINLTELLIYNLIKVEILFYKTTVFPLFQRNPFN